MEEEMFDKLIESDTTGAEFKNRSRYFMVSSVVVGILFLVAVVYSIYAADIGFVGSNLEVAELMAPVETVEQEKDEPTRSIDSASQNSTSQVRNSNIARIDETTAPPTSVSTVQNTQRTRDWRFDPKLPISDGSGFPAGSSTGRPDGTGSYVPRVAENDDETEVKSVPPPVVKKPPAVIRTSRVLNGEAISLPKPTYPQHAVVINLQGSVKVQVTIDEKGNVISAKAADGHAFFRAVAEQAARNARFKPTLLNDEPVKVTGVIVYNFKRN